jgi:predicted exporter
MAARLRRATEFSMVDDGEALTAEATQDFVFQHRYLLSDAVTPARFSAAGLRAAIGETVANLASTSGLMLKSLVPRDPTGETLHIIDQWSYTPAPRTQDGVWQSADGARTLLVAQTAAPGSDTDAQERAEDAIERAFRASVSTASIASQVKIASHASIASAPSTVSAGAAGVAGARGAAAPAVRLRMSGPGIFAVAARAKIKLAATRLSILGSLLVIGMLLAFYRSMSAVLLGLLPVATGALFGIAAVALGFGAVHGITLGFGITLIGESVDYSIYFFIQSRQAPPSGSGNVIQSRLPSLGAMPGADRSGPRSVSAS